MKIEMLNDMLEIVSKYVEYGTIKVFDKELIVIQLHRLLLEKQAGGNGYITAKEKRIINCLNHILKDSAA